MWNRKFATGILLLTAFLYWNHVVTQFQSVLLLILGFLPSLGGIIWKYIQRPRNIAHLVHKDLNPYLLTSASDLAKLLKNGTVTSVELTQLSIDQLTAVNVYTNSVVGKRFEQALKEAKECDIKIKEWREKKSKSKKDELPPFFGVPCTVKECYELIGFPHTSGLVTRLPIIAEKDGTGVKRMKEAGFIIIGNTNCSELCMWMETNNKIYGRTHNAYNLEKTVGGSSGGEASIISTCTVPLGLGGDVGGSIRLPAFFNGIFGHKPTGGTVPNTGQYPPSANSIERYCQTGPLCRYATDLWPLLNILAGPDGTNDVHHHEPLWRVKGWNPSQVKVKELTVISIESSYAWLVSRVDPELKAAQKRVAEYLKSQGCTVKNLTFPELASSFDIWSCMLALEDSIPFRRLLGNGKRVIMLWEAFKILCGFYSQYTFAALMLGFTERATEATPGRCRHYKEVGLQLRKKFDSLLSDGKTIVLYPCYPVPAPTHDWPLFHPFNFIYAAIFNVLELPVTECPLGLSSKGLPLGVQVVGAHGYDHVPIAVAQDLEKKFGGWAFPKSFT